MLNLQPFSALSGQQTHARHPAAIAALIAKIYFASSATPNPYCTRYDLALAICTVPSAVPLNLTTLSAIRPDASSIGDAASSNRLRMAMKLAARTIQWAGLI